MFVRWETSCLTRTDTSTKRIHCCVHMEELNVLELVAILLVLSVKRTAVDLLFITSDKSVM